MFETFELENLNKLVESEVRDFTPPKPFHTVKVQGFGSNKVKPSAKVSGKFPMPIPTLVSNFAVESCYFSYCTPPVVRAFDFSRKAFVEVSEFLQGLFQELWRLYFFAGVQCQVGIHTEVYPYALTCSRIGISSGVSGDNVKPKCSDTVTKDLDITDIALKLAVPVEREPTFVKLQGLRVGIISFERDTDASILKFVACFELRGPIAVFSFELRQSTESVEKALICGVNTDNHFVKRITGYPSPVLLGAFQQLRQVRLQPIPTRIFAVNAVIALLKFEKVIVNITQISSMLPKRIFCGCSRI